ncbi:MAG: SDR family oxidoreductase [Steroidobacter sp.]|jgi:NAD(P)-dependent dehydrogenase (short-subunit alcohol dehydrogenase family)
MTQWHDRVALVTGASSGIGRATALAFAAAGAQVVAADTNDALGEKLIRDIRERGSEGIFIRTDVAHDHEVAKLVDQTVRHFGRIDIAFNNAGIEGEMAATAECTEQNWDRVIAINLKGVWLCMKHELPLMLKQGKGAIVNCASIAGLVGFQSLPAYVASKHGVVGLTRTAALEYAKTGVRINAVCPGVILTPMVERVITANENMRAQLEAGEPVGRLGKPEEIASAVLWLGSDGASFVTGQAIAVDGGWVAQ